MGEEAIDYTEMFDTPDEAADHFMIPLEEQHRKEAEWLASVGKGHMVCDLTLKDDKLGSS